MKFYFSGDVLYPGTIEVEAESKEAAIAKVEAKLDGSDESWTVVEMDTHGYLAAFSWNGGEPQEVE